MSLFTYRNNPNENQFNFKINLEKNNYFPGEQVNALVHIISKDFINLGSNYLTISYFIKQIEYWQNMLNENQSNNKIIDDSSDKRKEEYIKDKNNYYENIILSKEEKINLSLIEKNMFKNEMIITLKILLPKDMKPSLEWNKENNIYCFSRTILAIHIKDIKLYSYNYLFIKKEVSKTVNEINIKNTIGNEAFIFFWENDNIKFEIYSKKDFLPISSIFPVQIKVDTSQLKSELISINFAFKRKIKFMINEKQSIFLNTSDYTETLWEGQKILDKNEKTHSFKFEIPLIDSSNVTNQKKLNFNIDDINFNKKYWTYLMPSYSGNNIKCEYFLKIRPIINGNNIHVTDLIININLFHEENESNSDAINKINKIFTEVNDKIRTDNIFNNNNINTKYNFSLPDEEMLKSSYIDKMQTQ